MFVYNLKINGTKTFRIIIILVILIALIILSISIYLFYSKSNFVLTDSLPSNSVANIEANEYTNILKQIYSDIDTYVGRSINFTGYIYKIDGFNDSQFILARDMLINSDSQSVVVGFLCSYDKANDFKPGTWVNATGTIIKGYFHNEIPVIEIHDIKETTAPEDAYVYPPDNTYIPTSYII